MSSDHIVLNSNIGGVQTTVRQRQNEVKSVLINTLLSAAAA